MERRRHSRPPLSSVTLHLETLRETSTMYSRTCLIAIFMAANTIALSATPDMADNACSLLTSAQVSAATNTPVGEGTYLMPTFRKTCTWTASHPVAQGVKIVTVSFETAEMFSGGMAEGRNPGVSSTPVSGLGDSAYYLVAADMAALHIKKQGLTLKVAVYAKLPIAQVEAMEKTLAAEVVSKL